MIARYTRPAMGRVWSEENKFQKWLDVELAATETLADAGIVPKAAARKLRERARIDVARINEVEAKVRHDVIAFTIVVQESVGDPEVARWLHYGLTSNDVVDTAQALLIREASRLIQKAIGRFGEILEKRAWEFKDTPEIGRTHGIHAEPITFGLKVANWYAENRRDAARFETAAREMAVGKISGAVGTCTHLGPDIEHKICARLGLVTAPITSQVIERDRHAQYLSSLAILAASLERVATEIRHLQRTEVRELEEPFGGEQRGSSAMPHKRNPVGSEQVCGLARVVRANSIAAYENIALWHERDISHSSVERVILPDSTILADYMLHRMSEIVANMKVFPERMRRNLDATHGLVFSGQVLQDLVEHGAPREEAYKWVQGHAMAAWESETSFKDRIAADKNIKKFISKKDLARTFDLHRQLQAVDAIFHRVFRHKPPT
ncbi:MAG TPA: adenylosuccinate lyase [Candidatus Cybelea sp.]|nr:adenylosuccinate lyase [Candidatus Cybelea sp.]